MPALSKLFHRLAALAILVLLVASAWFLILGPVATYLVDIRERIETERTLLGRLLAAQDELAGEPQLAPMAAISPSVVHLQGGSEAIGLANLQANVTAVAAGHGIRPHTTRMLPAIERDELRLAGIHIEIAAPIEAVQRILHTLESARPILFVEHLTLEPVTALARASGAEVGQLRTAIQIYGALPRRKE